MESFERINYKFFTDSYEFFESIHQNGIKEIVLNTNTDGNIEDIEVELKNKIINQTNLANKFKLSVHLHKFKEFRFTSTSSMEVLKMGDIIFLNCEDWHLLLIKKSLKTVFSFFISIDIIITY